jgi:acyl phosphate:glycerol-3-phosphate acyltransferase
MSGALVALAAYMIAAYLLGAVPFAYLMGRLKGVDIRSEGSHNIGATNCWRVCGWKYGLTAFLLDVAKGLVVTFGAWMMTLYCPLWENVGPLWRNAAIVAAGLGVIIGHVLPVYLRFKGGKAVATSLGVMLGIPSLTVVAAALFVLWLIVFLATRYVSVASTVAAVGLLVLGMLIDGVRFDPAGAFDDRLPQTILIMLVVALVLWRHRENYRRLLAGTENRFGRKP